MAKQQTHVNANPLAPAQTQADWEAQGWAPESEPLTAAPRLETTISIRFDPDSALLLRRAARLKGSTKSEFVRQATLREARKIIDETPLPIAMWISNQQNVATVGHGCVVVGGEPAPTAITRGPRRVVALVS